MKNKKTYIFKVIRLIGRFVSRRRIFLVSDRSIYAGDNGECFYKYLLSQNVDAVFAIKKCSKDYERLKKIGKIVEYDSLKFKFFYCICECYCSSQLIHMENHNETPKIFLQHGVAETDISKMLKPCIGDNFYIVTSGQRERKRIIDSTEKIDKEHVWLTGLPRFDHLESSPKKKVVVMFTWRERLLNTDKEIISKTPYYKEILKIAENKELNNFLGEQGYELCFMLHPEMSFLKEYLKENKSVKLYEKSYNELFREASLVVTDYSSVIYDFVYLNKPIIYYQFDNYEYFSNHFTCKGDMDYERDGFGPVAYDFDTFVKNVKDTVLSGCSMNEKYSDRRNAFFEYFDKKNSERIYQKVLKVIGN